MQIGTLLEVAAREKLPPLQQRVLRYLEEHADEVFTNKDGALVLSLDSKPASVSFSLWALEKNGLIAKETVAGKVYFGSREAIDSLRNGLGRGRDEGFEAAIANMEKIRARIGGNLDGVALLNELRDER